jgi:hypothetical protein
LLIILDDLRWANLCVVGIKADVAKGTSLAQEVPALIQFDLDFFEPLPIGFVECPLLVQSVLLSNQALNVRKDRLIFVALILHEDLSNRGWNRHVTILCYAYPKLRSTAALATCGAIQQQATLHIFIIPTSCMDQDTMKE